MDERRITGLMRRSSGDFVYRSAPPCSRSARWILFDITWRNGVAAIGILARTDRLAAVDFPWQTVFWSTPLVKYDEKGKTKINRKCWECLTRVMRLCILHSGGRVWHRTRVRFAAVWTMNTRHMTRRWRHWAWAHHRFRPITSLADYHILMHWCRCLSHQCCCCFRWTRGPINRMVVGTGVQNGRAIAQRNHTIRYVWLVFRCSGCHNLIWLAVRTFRICCVSFNVKCRRYRFAANFFNFRLIGRCRDVVHIGLVGMREFFHFRLIWRFQFACTVKMCTFEVCGEIVYRTKLLSESSVDENDDKKKKEQKNRCFSLIGDRKNRKKKCEPRGAVTVRHFLQRRGKWHSHRCKINWKSFCNTKFKDGCPLQRSHFRWFISRKICSWLCAPCSCFWRHFEQQNVRLHTKHLTYHTNQKWTKFKFSLNNDNETDDSI